MCRTKTGIGRILHNDRGMRPAIGQSGGMDCRLLGKTTDSASFGAANASKLHDALCLAAARHGEAGTTTSCRRRGRARLII